jgi:hypothetical protein
MFYFFIHGFSTAQISNAALVSGLIIAEGVVETAQLVLEALPECGGFFTGDFCSAITTPLKIVVAVVIAGSRIVRLPFVVAVYCFSSTMCVTFCFC